MLLLQLYNYFVLWFGLTISKFLIIFISCNIVVAKCDTLCSKYKVVFEQFVYYIFTSPLFGAVITCHLMCPTI